jgi:hypothetical protein
VNQEDVLPTLQQFYESVKEQGMLDFLRHVITCSEDVSGDEFMNPLIMMERMHTNSSCSLSTMDHAHTFCLH